MLHRSAGEIVNSRQARGQSHHELACIERQRAVAALATARAANTSAIAER
jgi:hypothetical protein